MTGVCTCSSISQLRGKGSDNQRGWGDRLPLFGVIPGALVELVGEGIRLKVVGSGMINLTL